MTVGWRRLRIGDLVDGGVLQVSDGYRMRNEELGTTGIPFVRGGDIRDGWIDTGTVDHIREEFAERIAVKLARPGDVAFITKGTVGRAGMLREGQPRVVFAPQVAYWRVLDATQIEPRFLFYLFRSADFQASLDAVKTHGAMVADYVSISQQHAFRLMFPPIGEQRAIARILGALDDKIELNRRTNETLEAVARTLFKSWFVDFDPVRAKSEGRQAVGMDAATATLFPDAFESSELDVIPKAWRRDTLEAHADCAVGFPFQSALYHVECSGVRLLRGVNVAPCQVSWSNVAYWNEPLDARMERYVLAPGDIVLAMDRPWIPAGLKLAMIGEQDLPSLLVQRVARLRGTATMPSTFLYWLLREPAFERYVLQIQTGTTVPHISATDILKYSFVVPPVSVSSVFDRIAAPIQRCVLKNSAGASSLAALRDSLLPKLLSGELRVRDAERIAEAAL